MIGKKKKKNNSGRRPRHRHGRRRPRRPALLRPAPAPLQLRRRFTALRDRARPQAGQALRRAADEAHAGRVGGPAGALPVDGRGARRREQGALCQQRRRERCKRCRSCCWRWLRLRQRLQREQKHPDPRLWPERVGLARGGPAHLCRHERPGRRGRRVSFFLGCFFDSFFFAFFFCSASGH